MCSGERRVGEAQLGKKPNASLKSDLLDASANFVFLCFSPLWDALLGFSAEVHQWNL